MKLSFTPAQNAVELLELIAAEAGPHQERAKSVLKEWEESLAPREVLDEVRTSDELEVDDNGAACSIGEDGVFVQTWTFIPKERLPGLYADEPGDELEDEPSHTPPCMR